MQSIDVMRRETIGIILMFSALLGWVDGELLAGAPAQDFLGPSAALAVLLGFVWSRVLGVLVRG